VIEHWQKLLSRLPTDEVESAPLAAARALQHTPVAEDQRPRGFSYRWIGQRFEDNLGTDSRGITHGDSDNGFPRHASEKA
jgi:hypothetical protein